MIERFVMPAVTVDAIQFKGPESVDELFHWLNGLYHIQPGEWHELREVHELNEEGRALATAPSFLVIRTREGEERVDVGDWVVKFHDIDVLVYTGINFAFKFERAGNQ